MRFDRPLAGRGFRLSGDALYVFGQAEAARQRAATEGASVSTSADFEGVDMSVLTGLKQA